MICRVVITTVGKESKDANVFNTIESVFTNKLRAIVFKPILDMLIDIVSRNSGSVPIYWLRPCAIDIKCGVGGCITIAKRNIGYSTICQGECLTFYKCDNLSGCACGCCASPCLSATIATSNHRLSPSKLYASVINIASTICVGIENTVVIVALISEIDCSDVAVNNHLTILVPIEEYVCANVMYIQRAVVVAANTPIVISVSPTKANIAS